VSGENPVQLENERRHGACTTLPIFLVNAIQDWLPVLAYTEPNLATTIDSIRRAPVRGNLIGITNLRG